MENAKPIKQRLGKKTKTSLGLAGASFAIFLGLLQVQELDTWLLITIISFAIIFPPNLFIGIAFEYQDKDPVATMTKKEFAVLNKTIVIVSVASIVIAAIGIICLVMHFSIIAGVVLICATAATFLVLGWFMPRNLN